MDRKFAVSLILVSLVAGAGSACGSDAGEVADGDETHEHDHHSATDPNDAGTGSDDEEAEDGADPGADGTDNEDNQQGPGNLGGLDGGPIPMASRTPEVSSLTRAPTTSPSSRQHSTAAPAMSIARLPTRVARSNGIPISIPIRSAASR
jgi:hypothetical protein